MALIGYARVSTADQNLDPQTDALTAAGCEKIFTDKASGKLARRAELDAALAYLRPGDILVITKLDRLGRSLRNLLDLSATLAKQDVGLRVLAQGIDTTTPGGRLYFSIIGAIAEFERDLISERTHDGLAAARARGRKGGRPPVLTETKLTTAREMYDSKRYTMAQIAETVGCSRATLYRALSADDQASAVQADVSA